jgi:hypothetical protein
MPQEIVEERGRRKEEGEMLAGEPESGSAAELSVSGVFSFLFPPSSFLEISLELSPETECTASTANCP